MKVGVARETAPGERRVALVPEVIGKLIAGGHEVLVEQGAGDGAAIPDGAYVEAGARSVSTDELYGEADVVLRVQKPSEAEVGRLRKGQAVVGFLQPLIDPGGAQRLAERGATAISLDMLPRTLSRAQTMDALSSQANVGGYKAVLIACNAFGRYFPLLTTAAGTAKPANVLVLGIGVAGLQAIATARRLGAVVRAYDVRSETREQAESLGGQFLVLKSVSDASGSDGYARELSAEERVAQQEELNGHIAGMDVVITTAQVPGRRPPVLVTEAAVRAMKPGSVIVDMAASALGGNVELSKADEVVVTDNGVTIHAPTNLPATMPAGASNFYARNISALLLHFLKDGTLNVDLSDEITAGTVVTHEGAVVHEQVKKMLQPAGESSESSAGTPPAAGRPPAPDAPGAPTSSSPTPASGRGAASAPGGAR
ncbi:MAG: Re/Si-specific NAD(P)(+) transhydrogenase subunit alpha [Candidatus Limnocylindrales bacterium]